jgi:maltose alpha-D-glucosyltransferase/alpha-amylase
LNQRCIWYTYVTSTFIKSYLDNTKSAEFVKSDTEFGVAAATEIMLNAYIIEKAVYEIEYELNNRPDWVDIPLHGLKILLYAVNE